MNELIEWLKINKICFNIVDQEVIEIPEFGKMFFEDTNKIQSIFRVNKNGDYIFNSMESPEVLLEEGIEYIVFKFGNNWYYTNLHGDFQLNILKYIGNKVPDKQKIKFVNLGTHSSFELLNGSFLPKMWVKKAKFLGHTSIGICDKNTMAACYNLQKECEQAGINPVFGYSLTFIDGENKVGAKVYVQSQEGLQNLLRIQKAIMVDSQEHIIELGELLERGKGNVLVLDKYSSYYIVDNKEAVLDLQHSFNQVYFQVDLSEYKAERIDRKVLEATKYYFDYVYSKSENPRPILISDCYYLDKDDCKNKIILNKIADGAAHEQSQEQYFKDIDDHYVLFEQLFDSEKWDIPALFNECCAHTIHISENAVARFENTKNFMPKYDLTDEEKRKYGTSHNMFNQLIENGLKKLIPAEKQEEYRKQMEYEKYIIESTNNVDYLLVQYDTCNWAKKNNILVGCGRGSAAGSLLLYLLGITLIDPIKFGLIFERFLLPERAGLYQTDTTIIGNDIDSKEYVELELETGKFIQVDKDAELIVKRDSEKTPVIVYADELLSGDDILFDNKDLLFTLDEINY